MASADLAAANGKRQQRPFVGPGEPAGNADARREARSCEAASFWRRILKNPEIKFGGSVTRADVLASLDRLAELGGRLDGPYRLGAAYAREQLNVGAAIRLKRRDDAILELRLRWHSHRSNNAAAKEI